jgi:drug/metabolite transporter (DMT)-like permease
MENFDQAQQEMRTNYSQGAVGVITSGFIWLISGFAAYIYSPKQAVWTLFLGGMLIHPLSIVFNKMLGVSGNHSKNNPLGNLAAEGTFFMLMGIPLAFVLSFQRAEWFFQGMLLIIGGRYLTFNTIYGNRLYWILGAVLGVAGFLLFSFNAQSYTSAFAGSMIEICFGLFVLFNSRKKI